MIKRLKNNRIFWIGYVVCLVVGILLPKVITSNFAMNTVVLSLIWSIMGIGWNFIGGYAGQVSNGHALYYALGAYAVAIGANSFGLSPWVSMWIGMAISAAIAFVLGKPLLRLNGAYFLIATMAVAECARVVFLNMPSLGGATGIMFLDKTHSQWYSLQFKNKETYHDLDPYIEAFFLEEDPVERCRAYLQDLLHCLKRIDPKLFSGLAHLDYLAKGFGAKYLPGGVFRYEYAPEEMDALMTYAIENGKCIEINTSSPQSLRGADAPALTWLRRYRQLGGQFVTIGSDAHRADRFGENIRLALELAKEAGIDYVATYSAMEPVLHKI